MKTRWGRKGVTFVASLRQLFGWIRTTLLLKRPRGRCGLSFLIVGWWAALFGIPLICTFAVCQELRSSFNTSADSNDRSEISPEDTQRLTKIEKVAGQLFKEQEEVDRERRPYVMRRDSMFVEGEQARARLARNQAAAMAVERQIGQLENQTKWATGSLGKEVRAQITRQRTNLNALVRKMNADQKVIDEGVADINALNRQIASLDKRFAGLEEQMNECRRQWLSIRQPFEKYSHGDFEGLRRVLDDWLVKDAHWPEAYAWAALCAYELQDIHAAAAYLDKAQRLRAERSTKRWPQLEALTALIQRQQPGQSFKADAALSNAIRLADKNKDWETYFLVGRYYFERPNESVRAQSYFERALLIHPQCDCARLWMARLQTISTLETVRDVQRGTECLEQLWDKSGRQSWRIASFLAEAYTASERKQEAIAMQNIAAELKR